MEPDDIIEEWTFHIKRGSSNFEKNYQTMMNTVKNAGEQKLTNQMVSIVYPINFKL